MGGLGRGGGAAMVWGGDLEGKESHGRYRRARGSGLLLIFLHLQNTDHSHILTEGPGQPRLCPIGDLAISRPEVAR